MIFIIGTFGSLGNNFPFSSEGRELFSFRALLPPLLDDVVGCLPAMGSPLVETRRSLLYFGSLATWLSISSTERVGRPPVMWAVGGL